MLFVVFVLFVFKKWPSKTVMKDYKIGQEQHGGVAIFVRGRGNPIKYLSDIPAVYAQNKGT